MDYLPKPKTDKDNQVDHASAAAEKRDIAARYGGTYLSPGKIYRNENESAREAIKKRLDEAQQEDHRKSHETLTKGAVNVSTMSWKERAGFRMLQNPVVILGMVGSFVTIFFGARAAYKGKLNQSHRLMNVRLGFAVMTVSALFLGQHMQRVKYQERLQILKKELLEELGEDENSLSL